jgi:isopenicillin N synthase-like dioxygenase
MSIPLIDVGQFSKESSDARRRIAASLDRALRDDGFFLLHGHGIPASLVADLRRVSCQFFARPFEEKTKVARPSPNIMRGYVAMGRESLAHSRDQAAPPDLNESFMVGQPNFRHAHSSFPPNLWPEYPPLMKSIWTEYYCRMETLAAEILPMFATALQLDDDFFDNKFKAHTSRLRARYYPAQSAEPQPGQLRAGAHTDYGSIAILSTDDRPGGLQVRERSGLWIDVPLIDGCFIVNIGDLMARWTNDRWPAAVHRVVNPPRDVRDSGGRLSHIYFQSPSDDTLIECLDVCCDARQPAKYLPVRAGEYLSMKFKKVDQADRQP